MVNRRDRGVLCPPSVGLRRVRGANARSPTPDHWRMSRVKHLLLAFRLQIMKDFLCPVMTPCGRVTACGVNTRRSLRPRACEGSTERGLEVEQSFPPQRACSRCNRCNRGLALSGHPLLAFGECEGRMPGRTGRIVWNRLPVKPLLLASMIVDGAVWRTVHVLLYV